MEKDKESERKLAELIDFKSNVNRDKMSEKDVERLEEAESSIASHIEGMMLELAEVAKIRTTYTGDDVRVERNTMLLETLVALIHRSTDSPDEALDLTGSLDDLITKSATDFINNAFQNSLGEKFDEEVRVEIQELDEEELEELADKMAGESIEIEAEPGEDLEDLVNRASSLMKDKIGEVKEQGEESGE